METSEIAKHEAVVSNITWLTHKVIKIDLSSIIPSSFVFIPGQFINLEIAPDTYRSYSLCSDSRLTDFISFVVSAKHEGVGANYIRSLKKVDKVSFIGPSGRFRLADKIADENIFLATGTGIGPFISMFYKLLDLHAESVVKVYFGERTKSDLYFIDFLEETKTKLPNFNYHICLSQADQNWEGTKGYITEFFNIENTKNVHVYICGNPNMVEDARKILNEMGVPNKHVFAEKY